MALIYEGMTCAICAQPLDADGPFVATLVVGVSR